MATPNIQPATAVESPFRELLDNLDEAVAWMAEHSLYVDRIRLSQYRRDIEELMRADEGEALPELLRERAAARLLGSVVEASEIRRVYRGAIFFAGTGLEPGIRALLERASAEAEAHSHGGGESGRDLGLDMTLAARLSASGFAVEVDDDGGFVATIAGRTVCFESVRVSSARDAGVRIREAERRIADRCRTRAGARAVLALAVSRHEDLGLDLLTCPDPMQLSRRLETALDQFLDRYEPLWSRPPDASLIGVWVYVGRPVLVGSMGRLLYAQRFALESTPFVSEEDDDLLWLIDQRFRFLAELAAALL